MPPTLAVALAATATFKAVATDDQKEHSGIDSVMDDHFKSDPSSIKQAVKGKLSKDEIAKLVAAMKTLPAAQPPKGEAASWKEKPTPSSQPARSWGRVKPTPEPP